MSHRDELSLWTSVCRHEDPTIEPHVAECRDCASRVACVRRFDAVLRTLAFWTRYRPLSLRPGPRLRDVTSLARRLRRERREAKRLIRSLGSPERAAGLTATAGLVVVLLDAADERITRDPAAALRIAAAASALCRRLSSDIPEQFRLQLLVRGYMLSSDALRHAGCTYEAIEILNDADRVARRLIVDEQVLESLRSKRRKLTGDSGTLDRPSRIDTRSGMPLPEKPQSPGQLPEAARRSL